MADVEASAAIWDIRAEEITLTPNEKAPHLLRLELCDEVRIVLSSDRDVPEQAAAMRRLAQLATEAAEELDRALGGKGAGAVTARNADGGST